MAVISNPVASELILPTAFETALWRLYHVARATGNDIISVPVASE
ncbi:hypothetical protein QUB30_04660 [Microcoleus sp. BROC3]